MRRPRQTAQRENTQQLEVCALSLLRVASDMVAARSKRNVQMRETSAFAARSEAQRCGWSVSEEHTVRQWRRCGYDDEDALASKRRVAQRRCAAAQKWGADERRGREDGEEARGRERGLMCATPTPVTSDAAICTRRAAHAAAASDGVRAMRGRVATLGGAVPRCEWHTALG
jgi:hypothetical protein